MTAGGETNEAVALGVPDARLGQAILVVARGDGNAEAALLSGKEMAEVAEEVCRFAGLGSDSGREARHLLARTRVVADRCALDPRFDLGLGEVHFPEFDVVTGEEAARHRTADGVLRARCEAGIDRRYGSAPRQRIWKRLDDELQIIGGLGYAPYFLTVHEIVRFARDRGILCQGRGSAANSAVCYVLGITAVDSIFYGLPFERFLSSIRDEEPDIDVDFDSDRREEVIQWVY